MIEIGRVGRIASGEEQARFVKVLDDAENTGGYLILTADDAALGLNVADNWVPDRAALEGYFDESSWVVEWTG